MVHRLRLLVLLQQPMQFMITMTSAKIVLIICDIMTSNTFYNGWPEFCQCIIMMKMAMMTISQRLINFGENKDWTQQLFLSLYRVVNENCSGATKPKKMYNFNNNKSDHGILLSCVAFSVCTFG